ncbi:unnamed protein product, partial [Polarella glacialis]
YHDVSSHHDPSRMARGGAMDWGQQPGKFLRFRGTRMLDLDDVSSLSLPPGNNNNESDKDNNNNNNTNNTNNNNTSNNNNNNSNDNNHNHNNSGAWGEAGAGDGLHPILQELFHQAASSSSSPAQAAESSWLGRVLQESLGLTAWKASKSGSSSAVRSLRANASSGALQPCEAYILADAGAVPGHAGAGLFHRDPYFNKKMTMFIIFLTTTRSSELLIVICVFVVVFYCFVHFCCCSF